jgi:quercetin dioxygenase-like cupin family protein
MPWPPFSADGDAGAVSLGDASIVPSRVGLPGAVRASVARVTLPAGRYGLPMGPKGPSFVTVESGTALVTDSAGTPATLSAGTAAIHAAGATLDVQAAGDEPLTLLILTLSPA